MVMEAAAEVMAYMVDRMLDKHKRVILVCARGNHDTDAAGALALMMKFYYRKEERVNVLDSHGFYHYIEYGNWLLGIHHGDKQKMESLAGSMARDMAQAWGRTTHRLWCLGHFHKDAVKTLPGVKCKIFAALPPPDSWHASHGYAGDGEMEMMTFRREGGLYSTHVYNIPQPRHEPDVMI
jgi:rhodanese-related sulfurtransferase